LPQEEDKVKAESAKIFYERWHKAKEDKKYLVLSEKHRGLYEGKGKAKGRERTE